MKIKNKKDFWAGVMFITFGMFFSAVGSRYAIGTSAKMGPGYFPTALGVILILLGIFLSISNLSAKVTDTKFEKFYFQALLMVLGSVILFGLLLNHLGLIASLIILIVISSYASHEFSWKASLLNALVLIVISVVVFILGLKLDIQVWPSFISH